MQLDVSNDDDDADDADNADNGDDDDRWRNQRHLESFEGQNKIDSISFQDSL